MQIYCFCNSNKRINHRSFLLFINRKHRLSHRDEFRIMSILTNITSKYEQAVTPYIIIAVCQNMLRAKGKGYYGYQRPYGKQ